MFKKNSIKLKDGFDTLIGAGSVFIGNIKSEGTVKVDGKIKGNLEAKGDIYIGDKATVTGNISANKVHVSGLVEGNVHSAELVHLQSTARVYGDIEVESLITDEGAFFQGNCVMSDLKANTSEDKYSLEINEK
jgi:cytoskeletal protein CcmA (bactofilin family)